MYSTSVLLLSFFDLDFWHLCRCPPKLLLPQQQQQQQRSEHEQQQQDVDGAPCPPTAAAPLALTTSNTGEGDK
jgi:hypothetical protein